MRLRVGPARNGQADQVLRGRRFGPIGVASSQRGRGLGHLLMFRALEAIRGQGFRSAWFLWSEDQTARRLYHSAGFREVRRFAVLRKDLEV